MLTTPDRSHFNDFGLNDILDIPQPQKRTTPRTSSSARRRLTLSLMHPRPRVERKYEGFHYFADWDRLPSVNTDRYWRSERHFLFPSTVEKHCSLWNSKTGNRAPIYFHHLIERDNFQSTRLKTPKTKDWKTRTEFAKSIGLSELPTQTDDSFKQLYGLFDSVMKFDTEHDSVQTIRRIRRG